VLGHEPAGVEEAVERISNIYLERASVSLIEKNTDITSRPFAIKLDTFQSMWFILPMYNMLFPRSCTIYNIS
jgi:hypothetical protein